jgi:hypothetical protein
VSAPAAMAAPIPSSESPASAHAPDQPDTPHVARAERLPAVTRHQDAELHQPFDVLGQHAGPSGQLGDGELIHANHIRNRPRNDGVAGHGHLRRGL